MRTSNCWGGEENFSRQRRRRDNFSPLSFFFFLRWDQFLSHTHNSVQLTKLSLIFLVITKLPLLMMTVVVGGGGGRWEDHTERWEKREIKRKRRRNRNYENTVKICGGGGRQQMKVNEGKGVDNEWERQVSWEWQQMGERELSLYYFKRWYIYRCSTNLVAINIHLGKYLNIWSLIEYLYLVGKIHSKFKFILK